MGRRIALAPAQGSKHSRELTGGATVVMGRGTLDSLPKRFRPRPGRQNIVLTRDRRWAAAGASRASTLAPLRVRPTARSGSAVPASTARHCRTPTGPSSPTSGRSSTATCARPNWRRDGERSPVNLRPAGPSLAPDCTTGLSASSAAATERLTRSRSLTEPGRVRPAGTASLASSTERATEEQGAASSEVS